jgi:hypothetical protein
MCEKSVNDTQKQVCYIAFSSDNKKQMMGPHVQFRYLQESVELRLETRKPEAEEFHKELRKLRWDHKKSHNN